MNTKLDSNNPILGITTEIQKKYPELSKFLNEVPVNGSGSVLDQISTKDFLEYYNSLFEMVEEDTKKLEAALNEKSTHHKK